MLDVLKPDHRLSELADDRYRFDERHELGSNLFTRWRRRVLSVGGPFDPSSLLKLVDDTPDGRAGDLSPVSQVPTCVLTKWKPIPQTAWASSTTSSTGTGFSSWSSAKYPSAYAFAGSLYSAVADRTSASSFFNLPCCAVAFPVRATLPTTPAPTVFRTVRRFSSRGVVMDVAVSPVIR